MPFLSPKSSNTGILETKSNKILDRALRLRLLLCWVLGGRGGGAIAVQPQGCESRLGACTRRRGPPARRAAPPSFRSPVPPSVTRANGRRALPAAGASPLRGTRRPRAGPGRARVGEAGAFAVPFAIAS